MGTVRRLLVLAVLAALSGAARAGPVEWRSRLDSGKRQMDRGLLEKAEKDLLAATKEAEAFGASDPRLAESLQWLGRLYRMQSRLKEAEPILLRSLAIRRSIPDLHATFVASSLTELAILYHVGAQYAKAAEHYRLALEIDERELPPSDPNIATGLGNIGEMHRKLGRLDVAEPWMRRSLAIWEQPENQGDDRIFFTLNNLGLLLYQRGRFEEALPFHQRALAVRDDGLQKTRMDVALSLKNHALVYGGLGRWEEADAAAERSLEIRVEVLGPENPAVAQTLTVQGVLARDQGRLDEAEALFRRALSIREKALGKDHLDVAETLTEHAILLRRAGKDADAKALEDRAAAIRAKHGAVLPGR
jgi:tetratricopeptide (TPR) repeat protein